MAKTILSFGAHPDDIEIGCAGTESKLIRSGYSCIHVYVTSGDAGSRTMPKEELIDIRESEAKKSAEILGVSKVDFLHLPDGLTGFKQEQKITIINLIRKYQPEIIFLHSSKDHFPDHKIVHELVMSAIIGAQGPWYQDSKGDPWSAEHIYGYEVWHPLEIYELCVDISETINKKLKALRCFKCQNETTHYEEAFKSLARYRGIMSFSSKYAEVFEVLRTSLKYQVP